MCLVEMLLLRLRGLSTSKLRLRRVGVFRRLAANRGGSEGYTGGPLQAYLRKTRWQWALWSGLALHGRDGLREAAADHLTPVSWGYTALLVDSYITRGIDQACTPEKYAAEESNILKRTFDAYGALLFLARQPFVDPRRVAVVGVSQGGM